jgi:RNA polymerase sigma-70 factor (ECF subfamily)
MADGERPDEGKAPGLDQISTHWPLIEQPAQFVMRYAAAIRSYLEALLRSADAADEVSQDFLLRGILHGFVRTAQLRGRFRNYLKTAVRNAALNHLQRRKPGRGGPNPDTLAAPDEGACLADQTWLAEWRRCALDRAWQALEAHQSQTPGNLCHTVLRLAVDHQEEDSATLAARAATVAGRPLNAAAFRKQLSRARRLFAEALLAEVARTLEEPTRERIEEELIEVGLMPYVRDFLPPDWGVPR